MGQNEVIARIETVRVHGELRAKTWDERFAEMDRQREADRRDRLIDEARRAKELEEFKEYCRESMQRTDAMSERAERAAAETRNLKTTIWLGILANIVVMMISTTAILFELHFGMQQAVSSAVQTTIAFMTASRK